MSGVHQQTDYTYDKGGNTTLTVTYQLNAGITAAGLLEAYSWNGGAGFTWSMPRPVATSWPTGMTMRTR